MTSITRQARPVGTIPQGREFTAPGFSPGIPDNTVYMRTAVSLIAFDPATGQRIGTWSAPGWQDYVVPAGWQFVPGGATADRPQ